MVQPEFPQKSPEGRLNVDPEATQRRLGVQIASSLGADVGLDLPGQFTFFRELYGEVGFPFLFFLQSEKISLGTGRGRKASPLHWLAACWLRRKSKRRTEVRERMTCTQTACSRHFGPCGMAVPPKREGAGGEPACVLRPRKSRKLLCRHPELFPCSTGRYFEGA